ncbi:hypothetical protein [Brachybacterium phenoliresistens]|uniref:hypothetical protein n=1 Tax=Brachybacterium phenoliresistens TaxID=396014 RepID=UPI0031E07CC3
MTQGNPPSPYPGAPQGQDPQNPVPPQSWQGAPSQDQGGWQGQDGWQQPAASPQPAPQASPYAAPASSPYGAPASAPSGSPAGASSWQEVPQQAQPAGSASFGSPAGAPVGSSPAGAGYPGAVGATPGPDGVAWKRIRTLGIAMIALSVLAVLARLILDLAYIFGAGAAQDAQMGIQSGGAIGLGLANLVIGGGGVVLAFALFVIAVIVAVTAREKARLGGILVAVAVPVSAIAYWVLSFVVGFIAGAMGLGPAGLLTEGTVRATFGADIARILLIGVVYLVGSYFVFSTAKKKLGA